MAIFNREDSRTVLPQLEKKLDEMIDVIYPIGSLYYTKDTKFNPNTAWHGEWEKSTSGTTVIWNRKK